MNTKVRKQGTEKRKWIRLAEFVLILAAITLMFRLFLPQLPG